MCAVDTNQSSPPHPPSQFSHDLVNCCFFFPFFSSFLLEERCRFLSNFTTSTAEVELPGEFLMPKANTVSILWIIILSLGSTAKEDSEWQFKATITEKSSDTFASLGRFPIHTGLTPSPPPTNNVGRVYPELFPSFTVCEGTQKWKKNMNIFPRTFVLDCSLPVNFGLLIRIVHQMPQMWLICGVNTTESFLRLRSFWRESAEINQPCYHAFWRQKMKVVTWRERITVKKCVTGTKWSVSNFVYFLSLQHSPYYIRIARFMPRVELVQKHNFSARRLYIRGNNGKVCLDMSFRPCPR